METSSSDSETGERVKNVHSVIIKSKDDQQDSDKKYVYKRRLGDLIFDAHFEAGNLCQVERLSQYEYELMVRPDVSNPRPRLWFNFTVCNQLSNQCVIFSFVNFSETLKLFHVGLTPVVRSRSNPNWIRLHEDQVFYHRSRSHGHRNILSIAFRFLDQDNEHQFALFYPYTFTNLSDLSNRWTVELKRRDNYRKSLGRLHSKKLQPLVLEKSFDDKLRTGEKFRSKSSQGFVATDVSNAALSQPKIIEEGTKITKPLQPTVVVFCQSCGNLQSASSLVCQGIIDYMLCDDLVAQASRQFMDVICFPMLNPDSIYVGNSGTDLMGQPVITGKLLEANKSIYAGHLAIDEFLKKLCQSYNLRRIVILDIGVNLNLTGCRLVGVNYQNNGLRMERHLSFPRILARFCDSFYLENCKFQIKPKHTANIKFDYRSYPNVDQYKFEVSPFAFYKRSLIHQVYEEYNQRKYISIGKSIVYSLLELLKPKNRKLPQIVADTLEKFHHKPDDIDDLLLKAITS